MTLSETGQILVTDAAARQYAAARRLGTERGLPATEEARRELTQLLADARRTRTQPSNGAEGWRRRSRPLGVDVDAQVTRDGTLAVVVHVRARPYLARRHRERVR